MTTLEQYIMHQVCNRLEQIENDLEIAAMELLGRHNDLATQFAGSVTGVELTIASQRKQLRAMVNDLDKDLDTYEPPPVRDLPDAEG